jgi:phosphoribosylamine--glycine ligase
MKILLIEDTADGLLDLAMIAKRQGHSERYYCRAYNPVKAPVGRGLVERVPDWRSSMRWCDLCVVGGNGKWMVELDRWRAEGVPIIGGCAEAAAWELDRLAGMAAFKRAGIPVPPFRQCATLKDAMEYVEKRGEGCAVKPCGDIGDKSTSVVGKNPDTILWRLGRWQKEGKSFPGGLMVQDRIDGVEFAVGAWIGPDGFAPGWEENFEEKRLFAGSVGPATGEQGTTLRLVRSSKLAENVLKPLEDRLVGMGYVGNVDVNSIVDEDGTPWPLEWTMRLGWPAFMIECALHADPVEWLAGLAHGKPPNTRKMNEVAVGVVMSLPPYPHGHERTEEVVGVPIWGITPAIEDRVHFAQAMADRGQLATAGSYVTICTGTGETVQQARAAAYRVVDRVEMPITPQYRIDIGQRLSRQLEKLQAHGFARGMSYSEHA